MRRMKMPIVFIVLRSPTMALDHADASLQLRFFAENHQVHSPRLAVPHPTAAASSLRTSGCVQQECDRKVLFRIAGINSYRVLWLVETFRVHDIITVHICQGNASIFAAHALLSASFHL